VDEMGLFVRNMTAEESEKLNRATRLITDRVRELLNNPQEAYSYFHATDAVQYAEVIRCLRELEYIACGIYRVATKYHPISWIGYGLCVPYKTGKPILLSEKIFCDSDRDFAQIVLHEYTHSKLGTKDGKLGKGIDSEVFRDCITDAWKWTFLI
jgi:hypothetical protein